MVSNRDYVPLNILVTPSQKAVLEETAREMEVSVSALVRTILTYDKVIEKIMKSRRKK